VRCASKDPASEIGRWAVSCPKDVGSPRRSHAKVAAVRDSS
jgi:hypothetical protein